VNELFNLFQRDASFVARKRELMSDIGIEDFSNLPERGCSSLRKLEEHPITDDIASTGEVVLDLSHRFNFPSFLLTRPLFERSKTYPRR